MVFMSDEEIKNGLLDIAYETWNQGNNFYARQNKKQTAWLFGYTNDYPLQHGDGEECRLTNEAAQYFVQLYNFRHK